LCWTDPKELIKDHSPLTIEHELKRARFHMKVVEMYEKHGLELVWKKTDLNHTVKPDDVFAIKKDGKITCYFFELENKRKSFKEMIEKYRRYEEYGARPFLDNKMKHIESGVRVKIIYLGKLLKSFHAYGSKKQLLGRGPEGSPFRAVESTAYESTMKRSPKQNRIRLEEQGRASVPHGWAMPER
jgi:hypothetical protein